MGNPPSANRDPQRANRDPPPPRGPRRYPGDTQGYPGDTQGYPGDTQGLPRGYPGDTQGIPRGYPGDTQGQGPGPGTRTKVNRDPQGPNQPQIWIWGPMLTPGSKFGPNFGPGAQIWAQIWTGGALGPNNCIYSAPCGAKQVLSVPGGPQCGPRWCLASLTGFAGQVVPLGGYISTVTPVLAWCGQSTRLRENGRGVP